MSDELQRGGERGVQLLELHDSLDLLDDEIRVGKIALLLTPLVSIVLAAPLLIIIFVNDVRFFVAYPATFVILLGAILSALAVERRRQREEREAIRNRIRQIEVAPGAPRPPSLQVSDG
jgi:hypothetical protein